MQLCEVINVPVEIKDGFLVLTIAPTGDDIPTDHVYLKGSAIVKIIPYESSTQVWSTTEHGATTFVMESPKEILEAITASYKGVTRK
jgi:hypothetical protein